MSLVGPRPLLLEYLAAYTPEEHRRHEVRPGITSWAAVHGRHTMPFQERIALDVWYVDHESMLLDLRIIGMTLAQVLRKTDVRETQDVDEIGFPLQSRVTDGPPGGGGPRSFGPTDPGPSSSDADSA